MSVESEELRALSFVRRSLLKKNEKIREMTVKIRTLEEENAELKWKCSDQEKEIERLNATLGLNTDSFQSTEDFDSSHGDMLNTGHEESINDSLHAPHISSDNEKSLEGSSQKFIKKELLKEDEGSMSSKHNTQEEAFVESPELGNGFLDTLPGCNVEDSSRSTFAMPSLATVDMEQGSSSNPAADSQEAGLLLAERVLAEQFVAENSVTGPSSSKRLRRLETTGAACPGRSSLAPVSSMSRPDCNIAPSQLSTTAASAVLHTLQATSVSSVQPGMASQATASSMQASSAALSSLLVPHTATSASAAIAVEPFKPFKCPHAGCDVTMSLKENLKRHVIRRHPDFALLRCPSQDPACRTRTFLYRRDVRLHMQRSHLADIHLLSGARMDTTDSPR